MTTLGKNAQEIITAMVVIGLVWTNPCLCGSAGCGTQAATSSCSARPVKHTCCCHGKMRGGCHCGMACCQTKDPPATTVPASSSANDLLRGGLKTASQLPAIVGGSEVAAVWLTIPSGTVDTVPVFSIALQLQHVRLQI